MDAPLAEGKTGKIKETSSVGLEWDMGCSESGADNEMNTKLSER